MCAADLARHSIKNGVDHIHVHSCADAAHVVAMAKFLGGAPYSLHLHGDLPVYGVDHRQKMSGASFVAAAARPMQRQVIDEAGVPESRTYTLWMGVDTSRFSVPAMPRRRQGALHMVSVGRMHLCKGHRYTLQAMRRLIDMGADIRYTIAGSGPHEAEIAASVADGRFGDRVRLVGSLGEAEVLELLKTADAFVLSSTGIGEASPVAVMEAMAAGVPAVCSVIGGTPEMISDGVDGMLVAQEDVDGLASAIRRLHDDEAFRQRLGTAARQRAVEQFDSKATARKLLTAIEQSTG
jgi:glycosyltransferase involved in cell wall biosynthesis